jgi:hypothetical protein
MATPNPTLIERLERAVDAEDIHAEVGDLIQDLKASSLVRVRFVRVGNPPERMVCEAEIVFGPEAGPLAGMKMVGFSLWRSPEGETYITFPSRAFGAGSERRYFDYLRSDDGEGHLGSNAKRVKAWILAEWVNHNDSAQIHAVNSGKV